MLVWTDAQLSPAVARWLHAKFGVTAVPIRDIGLHAAEDSAIFVAARDAGAVLMTKDSDFVDLVVRRGAPPQVLWVTCGNTTNAVLQQILQRAWPRIVALIANGEPLVEISDAS